MDSNDKPTSIVPTSIAAQLAALATTAPEAIYDQLAKAEKWLKEIKETARQTIINRMAGADRLTLETDNYAIHAVKNKAKLNVERIHAILVEKGITVNTILFKTVVFEPLPTARDSIEILLKSKLITKEEYDTMFDKAITTVSVKAKSAKSTALNLTDGEE